MTSPQRFTWLDAPQREYLRKTYFEAPMPRGRAELVYRDPPAHMDQRLVDGKRHVVFCSYYLQPAICKKAWALRKSGDYHLTFIGCCIRQDHAPERFFDQCHEARDYEELYTLLASAGVWAVVSVIQPLVNGALAVEAAVNTGALAVVDINDSLYYMRKDPNDFECQIEARILKRASAVVHKMPGWGVERMRADWRFETPDWQVHSLPEPEIFQPCGVYDGSRDPAFVFAGGIIPYHIAVARGHENHIMDPLIHAVCGHGGAMTFVVNQNAREMFWQEHQRYIDFQNVYPAFSFEKGVPFFQLPAKLAAHDFAIYWENIPESSYNPDHFAINMATKIFSYVEAGLPILVHTQAPYIHETVVEGGFGLSYELKDLEKTPDMARACDYETLCRNLKAYRDHTNSRSVAMMLGEIFDPA
ncbi:hypothetical protein NNJEOMEG_02790 [Fundidesulfovibrio magnetotacticus]|uniref:Glycosyltransferase n=1 Tax=Fundidesulfovibrio magnetotacticus TaxID=2730080 RepID=A0A6V8LR19_9BACT|nr:hypothetical protein [Fundidesulfovibrio magnetotacticus]GFK94942.1 hypothetical protein NNJEOMEG_02790 [Fundidesulfovibrio magnetotacticus]